MDLITTTEASAITGRTVVAVRCAVRDHYLPCAGRDRTGRPLMERSEVLAWDRRTQRTKTAPRGWIQVREVLEELGAASAVEIGAALGIHEGNARKHLAILRRQGLAERHDDGQWTLAAADDTAAGQLTA